MTALSTQLVATTLVTHAAQPSTNGSARAEAAPAHSHKEEGDNHEGNTDYLRAHGRLPPSDWRCGRSNGDRQPSNEGDGSANGGGEDTDPMNSPTIATLAPTPDQYAYTFGGQQPLLTVKPGTVIELKTEDAFAGNVRSVSDLPSQVCTFPFLNPVTGPIAIEGAEPGDTLAVHFVEIVPARDWAVSATFPLFGALTTTTRTAMLHQPLEERVWVYDLDLAAGTCRFDARNSDFSVELPLDPMHGTVGVAPAANEVIMSITPAAHGGNMDTPEMRAGTTAYFGVNVEGGLLSIGDGHARQGEGEVCGTALEAAMNSVVVVDLIKGQAPPSPRIESDDFLMTTGSGRPLEDAFRMSQHDLIGWTGLLLGLDDLDAYQLVSQAALSPAGNVVDTNYTMVGKLPKNLLGSVHAFDGMHGHLQEIAQEYLIAR
jgi:acetamidase/formamidase